MTAVDNGDTEAARKMVEEAAKEAGYTLHAYHGTPNGNFTVFRGWQYFTENPTYAERYKNIGASSVVKKTAESSKVYDVFIKADHVFDTRKPKERKLFMNEFYQKWGNGAPLGDLGLPDWTDGDDLIEFFDENELDYDMFLLDEGGDGGYGEDAKKRGISYIVRDSNQIKSADLVVRDDEGNVIPLSERFDESKQDIRWSQRDDYSYANLTDEDYSQNGFVYSYDFLTAQKPMKVVSVPAINELGGNNHFKRADILQRGNIFQTRMTNAICEGINSMIQAAKRKARGFHTFEGFSSMIDLIAAKLSLACPNLLR